MTGKFHAYGYGGRAEFGRGVAGMAVFFMVTVACLGVVAWMTLPKRARLQTALENIERFSSVKFCLCIAFGFVLFGYAMFKISAGDMLIDWDDPRPGRFARMMAIHMYDWAAGVTIFLGACCGMMSQVVLSVFDALIIGAKRGKFRIGREDGRGGGEKIKKRPEPEKAL